MEEELEEDLSGLLTEKALIDKSLGAKVVLCGKWLWAEFSGKPATESRETLKGAGYKWASKKGKWYFAGCPRRNRKGMSYEYITSKYGEEELA
jgi:hypothetical protein